MKNLIGKCKQDCYYTAFRVISVFTMLVTWGLILHFAYLQLVPMDIITTDGAYRIDKTEVKRGETITVTQSFCKTRNVGGEARTYFRDGIYFMINSFPTNQDAGCQEIDVSYTIPETLPYGEYQIYYVFNYHITPFRDIQETEETLTFTVIE